MPVYSHIAQTVGRTPMVRLSRLTQHYGLKAEIVGKLEMRNPTGSVKDRIAIAMIEDAKATGILSDRSRIVSASSGNTGIALASAAACFGYAITIVMPESMSKERVAMLRLLGAEVILTPGALMGAAVAKADEILKSDPHAVRLRQFENPANPKAHRETTAEEIWEDCQGNVAAFCAGVGTGGTLTGVGQFLKSKDSSIHVAAVEPENCAVLSGKNPGPHYIQGIGAGFVPTVLDRDSYDEVIAVSDSAATKVAVQLARNEGIFAGISAGANLAAACRLAEREEFAGKTIVTILCDTGERYLSTALVDEVMR